jgi:uncharacterized protein
VRFWDSSAVVPLLAEEPSTAPLRRLHRRETVVVWWGTVVECGSAIARLERGGALTPAQCAEAFSRLDALRRGWIEVEPTEQVRDTARRLLRVHPLRAADALQLAAAWVASEQQPSTLPLVTLDQRLRDAAMREGFPAADL